jgi:hypothetical protein
MSRQASQFPLLATVLLNATQYARLEAACAQRKMGKSQLLRALVEEHLPELPAQAGVTPALEPSGEAFDADRTERYIMGKRAD